MKTSKGKGILLWGLFFGLLLLGGCALHLRQPDPLPFTTIYTNIDLNSEFGNQLRLALEAMSPGTHLVNKQSGAQLQLIRVEAKQSTHLTAINPNGQPDEYELISSFSYTILNAKGQTLVPTRTIVRNNFVAYDATQASAESQKLSLVLKTLELDIIPVLINQLNAPTTRAMLTHPELDDEQ